MVQSNITKHLFYGITYFILLHMKPNLYACENFVYFSHLISAKSSRLKHVYALTLANVSSKLTDTEK